MMVLCGNRFSICPKGARLGQPETGGKASLLLRTVFLNRRIKSIYMALNHVWLPVLPNYFYKVPFGNRGSQAGLLNPNKVEKVKVVDAGLAEKLVFHAASRIESPRAFPLRAWK